MKKEKNQRNPDGTFAAGNQYGTKKNPISEQILKLGNNAKHNGKVYFDSLAEVLWTMALNGNLRAIEIIYDRVEGKLKSITKSEEDEFVDFGDIAAAIRERDTAN